MRSRAGPFAALFVMTCTGCGARALPRDRSADDEAIARAGVSAPPRVGPAAAPAPAAPEPEAERVVAAALGDAVRVRKLASRGPVRGVLLSRKEMATRVRESIAREIPKDVVRAEGDLLIALGLTPPTFDYVEAIVALMTAELAGYYEPLDKTMYLASDLGAPERRATLAHELVHALQDQHYDLGGLLDYEPDASDVQGAVHALAEGDAMSAMLDQLLEGRGQTAMDIPESLLGVQARAAAQFSSAVRSVPDVLKRSLIAPYVDGLSFVHWLRRRGGWAEVDKAWQQPIASTEQLLHPEKFVAREPPVVVDVPPGPAEGPGAATFHDVIGEQTLRVVFEEWLPRRPAADAAADWGGDRAGVYREGDRVAAAIHVRYESEGAAERGFAAFRAGVEAQARPRALVTRTAVCAERQDRGPISAMRSGRDVAVVAGPYRTDERRAVSGSDCGRASAWARRVLAGR